MSNVRPLRARAARPGGGLELSEKDREPGWIDATEVRVAPLRRSADAPRAILITIVGPPGEFSLPLSAGEAAGLMFEIGHALEQAATAGPSPCHA